MNKPHVHAELIKKWADGAVIEASPLNTDEWILAPRPQWLDDWKYRVRPERVFPKSSMGDTAWARYQAVCKQAPGSVIPTMTAFADEVVKQYILDTEEAKNG